MTFAEYNTDENFDKNTSSLKELVEIGKAEGKTVEEIKSGLSPKWKTSKYFNEIDNYFNTPTAPKTFTEKATANQNAINNFVKENEEIKKTDKDYLDQTNSIADTVQKEEEKKSLEGQNDRYENIFNQIETSGKGFKKIDDKMIENIPTFIWNRYKNGEFGTPGSKDAKARFAHFIIDGFGSSLKVLSNGLSQMAGRSPMFADTTSDWEKYQQTNLAKGMENRWKKYEAETDAAIDLLKKQNMEEQDIQNGIAKIATNNRLQTAFNMMNEKQKAYLIQVTEEIGDKIGSFNNDKLINFLVGSAISNDKLTWQEAAEIAVAKFGKDALNGKFDEQIGKIKDSVKGSQDQTAGYSIGGNLQNYETIDGEKLTFKFLETQEGKQKLLDEAQKLSQMYYDGKIDADTFKKYYEPLYTESKKHRNTALNDADKMIKTNNENHLIEIDSQINELNKQAKSGELRTSDYEQKFNALREQAIKWGADDKALKKVDKNKVSQETILKAADKKNKKSSKK